MIWQVYRQFPTTELGFLSATILIPLLTGIIGAILPAQRAVRIVPNAAISSVNANSKETERRFKLALSSIGAVLFVVSFPSSCLQRMNNLPNRRLLRKLQKSSRRKQNFRWSYGCKATARDDEKRIIRCHRRDDGKRND